MALTATEAQARSRLIDVESYDVFIDLTTEPPLSRTEVRFGCRAAGASTFAELPGGPVRSAMLNGQELTQPRDGRLTLPDLAARNVLTVETQLAYSPAARGLSAFTDPADGATYVLITAYPTSAPDLFCCFDQPDLSAAMTFSLRVQAGWECIGNAPVAQRPSAEAGGTWRFETMPAMRPYDVALCAGPFTCEWRADGPVQLTAQRRRSLTGADGITGLTWFGELASAAIRRYEQVLGVACPYRSYDIVVMPNLVPTALSVQGLMVVSERLVARLADPDDSFAAMICTHEVAHLWFGCLVGPRWWDDVWLDEAIATYLSYSPAISSLTAGDGWTTFGYRDKERAYEADQLPTTEPVSWPVASSDEARARSGAITYIKGASVIRQLAALIGDDALHSGFTEYLRQHRAAGVASLDDLIRCMSQAAGRDLTAWAREWLRTPGASTLAPEIAAGPGEAIDSFAVIQDTPRTHVIRLGLYDLDGSALRHRASVTAEVSGTRTTIPALAGEPMPSAVILNEGDLSYARIRFDEPTLTALAAVAMDVGDPLTEAVCWNAAWHLVTSGGLAAADLAGLIRRRLRSLRLTGSEPSARIELLLGRASKCADVYAPPSVRSQLREQLAEVLLELAERARPGSPQQRTLAEGFAASADSQSQLDLLRSWLTGSGLPDGLAVAASVRGQILRALAARGLATDSDLSALVSLDPVQGELTRATCIAARPDAVTKESAWSRALAPEQDHRLAQAYAQGLWLPGQETIMKEFSDRYFAVALPALASRDYQAKRGLGRDLFPSTIVTAATVATATEVLESGELDRVLADVVTQQRAVLQGALLARSAPQRPGLASLA